jgi:hypothetical protein
MTRNNLGNALRDIGRLKMEASMLKEAIDTYEEALKEYTRERVPLQWALAIGNQGIARMLLAALTKDLSIAEIACLQLEAAWSLERDGGHPRNANVYHERLLEARRLRALLKTR